MRGDPPSLGYAYTPELLGLAMSFSYRWKEKKRTVKAQEIRFNSGASGMEVKCMYSPSFLSFLNCWKRDCCWK